MTKQKAAALLREAKSGNLEAITSVYGALADLADLLDPPRDGLAKVQIVVAWDKDGKWSERGFGPEHRNYPTDEKAVDALDWEDEVTRTPTVITAYVPRPDRTVAQVEGEVEG